MLIGISELETTLEDLKKQKAEALETLWMCNGAILQVEYFLTLVQGSGDQAAGPSDLP